jgi:hypothetical protein
METLSSSTVTSTTDPRPTMGRDDDLPRSVAGPHPAAGRLFSIQQLSLLLDGSPRWVTGLFPRATRVSRGKITEMDVIEWMYACRIDPMDTPYMVVPRLVSPTTCAAIDPSISQRAWRDLIRCGDIPLGLRTPGGEYRVPAAVFSLFIHHHHR